MNVYAYHPDDITKTLVHIDKWVTQYSPHADGHCRICNERVYVKAAKSQKQTHFAHYQNSRCPTINKNHKPYEAFNNYPKDPTLARDAKDWTKENIIAVYEKVKTLAKGLSWIEFHGLLDTANKADIWSLKDMRHDHIPYVLLMCTDEFKKNNYGRLHNCFFVLETSPNNASHWNADGLQKNYIWQVNIPSREVTHHTIELSTRLPWYINKCNSLLN